MGQGRRSVRIIGSVAAVAVLTALMQTPATATAADTGPDAGRDVAGDFGTPLAVQTWAVPTGGAGLVSASQGPSFGQGGIVSWNGALWFAEEQAGKVGRVDTAGNITEYSLPAPASNPGYGPWQLSAATASGLWFLADGEPLDGRAARLNAAAGVIDGYYDVAGYARFASVTATPDGGAWVTSRYGDGGITRLSAAGAETGYFDAVSYAGDSESTLGPDGNLWFSDGSSVIQRITESGNVTNFAATGDAGEIVSMTTSGGAVWYAKFEPGDWLIGSRSGLIGRLSAGGVATPFTSPYPDLVPAALTPAADGGVWFTVHHGAGVGHVDPAGNYRVALLPEGNGADSVAVGPDGNLWYTDHDLNRVGVITMASFAAAIASQGPPPPPPGTPGSASSHARVAKKGTVVKGRAKIRVRCKSSGAKCRGKVVIAKKKRALAKGRYAVKAGKRKTVKVKLTKAGRKYFRTHRRAKLKVRLKSKAGSSKRKVVFHRKR